MLFTIPGRVIKPRKRRVNRIPFTVTDGGKKESGFLNESRDCTVRSLAVAAQIPYESAHKACSEAGRVPRHGLTNFGIKKACKIASDKHGFKFEEIPAPTGKSVFNYKFDLPHGTFAQMSKKYNKGRYIFVSRSHAFAVVDGVLHDSWHVGGRTQVGMIIKIESQQITQAQINELWARLDKLEGKC